MTRWALAYPTRMSRLLFRLGYRRADFDRWIDLARGRVDAKKRLRLRDRFALRYLTCYYNRSWTSLDEVTKHLGVVDG